jgi:aspartyl-tRNA(Asn)/glutamyl-tRNA(Gln) amidotransferase subunit B
MNDSATPYDVIIGLEVHVQLLTESKMFCACGTKFGEPPNTLTCPVCIGMPGALPVMNRKAVELAVKTALALNCKIHQFTKWDRKNYYYPDLPKGYQISQFDLPLSHDGFLPISDPKKPGCHNPAPQGRIEPKKVRILRVHLEEDAGKSMHDEQAGKADSRIDLNRAGTPLLEIVSQPDMRSPAEAKAYLTELKLLLNYLGVSDCNMQEGSLRVDANINLHVHTPEGKAATPIVEVKNMNSFRAVERAMAYEAERQYKVWGETHKRLGEVPKETRGWDDAAQRTWGQRSKEESSDYRYFPDPDLVPVTVSDQQIERARQSLGELPAQLRTRLEAAYGITPYDSDVIVNQGRALVDFYVEMAKRCGDGKVASNQVQQDALRRMNEHPDLSFRYDPERFSLIGEPNRPGSGPTIEIPVPEIPLAPDGDSMRTEKGVIHKRMVADGLVISGAAQVEVIRAVKDGTLTTSRGREVLDEVIATGKSVDEVMTALGIRQVDDSDLVALGKELLQSNPKILSDLKAGNMKAAGWLIGQAKKRNPNVNPNRFREICLELAKEEGARG